MTRLAYDSVEALIYDTVSANRTATRAAMLSLGFRRTETVSSLEAMIEVIQRQPPDLVLADTQGAADELCGAIQQLRQGAAGYNPFIVIIVTAWEKSSALISKVVNSGADDLLLRPFSTALLGARIEAHIERRKGFVITTDYVGPDRRRDANRSGDTELFDPPNSLKMKAKDKIPADIIAKKLDAELQVAREKLAVEKLRRDSFQICILWRLMQEHDVRSPQQAADLIKLANLARAVERRASGTSNEKAVEWCISIQAAVEGLRLEVDRNASMHLLGHAALSLHQLICPEKSPADQLNEIDATVAIIRARSQATALAS
ncbi:MAG TPA: response regulator [Rhizomicrobium sp.]|jgi:DNA-binding response OmpR family regulator